jgi:uncharacterized integral membrane protein
MAAIFLILALIIAILAVVFALQNADVIAVVFFTYSFEGSLALVLLVTFAVGVIAGIFFILPYLFRSMMRVRKLSREKLRLEESLGEDEDYDGNEEEGEEDLSRSIRGGF